MISLISEKPKKAPPPSTSISSQQHIFLYAIIVLLSLSLVVVLFSSSSPNVVTTTTAAIPTTTAVATSTRNSSSSSSSKTKQLQHQQSEVPLTLTTAFACRPPHNCFTSSSPLRIAFVGDSITYGNGTHAGDFLGNTKGEIGCWVSEVIQNLQNRGDQCEGSPFASSTTNNNTKSQNYFNFDARNFGIGKVSVTCQWNTIVKKPIFKRAVDFKPHVLVLGLGTNDCFHKCPEWSPEFFAQSLVQMVQKNFSSAQLVVMVAPPPMEWTPFTMALGFRPGMVQDPIVPLVRKVAKEMLKVPLLDVFADWSVEFKGGTATANDWNQTTLFRANYLVGDGIHPSLKGHQDIARRFEKLVCGW